MLNISFLTFAERINHINKAFQKNILTFYVKILVDIVIN